MIKAIDFDGYNEAEIHKMYEDGACVCTVRQIEEDIVIKEDTNIILENNTHFVLSADELNTLNPCQEPAPYLTE